MTTLNVVEAFKTDIKSFVQTRKKVIQELRKAEVSLNEALQKVADAEAYVLELETKIASHASTEVTLRKNLAFWVSHPLTDGTDPTRGLPDIVLIRIFSYLPMTSVYGGAAFVCRRWARLVRSPTVMKPLMLDIKMAKYATSFDFPERIMEDTIVDVIVAFRDGKRLYLGLNNGTIRKWEQVHLTREFRDTQTIKGHDDAVTCLVLSEDETQLFSGANDAQVKVWCTQNGDLLRGITTHEDTITSICQGNSMFYTTDDCICDIYAWSTKSIEREGVLRHHENAVCSLALAKDDRLISGSWDCSICVWTAGQNKTVAFTLFGHTGNVSSLVISNDNRLFSASSDKTIRVWNLKTQKNVGKITIHHGEVHKLVLSDKHQRIFSGSDCAHICVWSMHDLQLVDKIYAHQEGLICLDFANDTIFSGPGDCKISVWS